MTYKEAVKEIVETMMERNMGAIEAWDTKRFPLPPAFTPITYEEIEKRLRYYKVNNKI